jgi:hypothetical protein
VKLHTRVSQKNIPRTVKEINEQNLDQYVFQFVPIGAECCVVVFRTDSYPSYLHFCERAGLTPMSTSEYFK